MRRWILLLVLVFALFAAPGVGAQEDTPAVSDDEVNEIASQMFCPVCENVPLDVCPTQACLQWRETIRTMLAEGKTEGEIKAHFVQQYGDRVLAEPPRTGFNWLVYIVPPAALAVGAYILFTRMQLWNRAAPDPAEVEPETPDPGDEDYIRRLEEELERRS